VNSPYRAGAIPKSHLTDRIAPVHAYDSVIVPEAGEYRTRVDKWIGKAGNSSDAWTE